MGENEETIPCRLIPVLALVIEGKRNKEIAEECSFAEHTVEKYVSDLLTLYGCHSRTELALNPEARAAVGRGEIGGGSV